MHELKQPVKLSLGQRTLWMYCLFPFGICVAASYSAYDAWQTFRALQEQDLLTEAASANLEAGDHVWLEGIISQPEIPIDGTLMYGCEVEDRYNTGNWNEVTDYLAEPVPLRAALLPTEAPDTNHHLAYEIPVTVHLEEGCPEGLNWTWESGSEETHWIGYKHGQTLSIVGQVRTLDPLVVDATDHYGLRASHHRSMRWDTFWGFLLGAVVTFLIGGWWLYIALTRFGDPWMWGNLAHSKGLRFSRRHLWTPGRIEGAIDGRKLSFSRRRGVGNHSAMSADVLLRIQLNPCMEPYLMRKTYPLETWFRSSDSRGTHDPGLSPHFVFAGVDGERWESLVSIRGIRGGLLELQKHNYSVAMKRGWLQVVWSGFETRTMAGALDRALHLADQLEKAEARSWHRAAEAMELTFEHTPERWALESGLSTGPHLVYTRREPSGRLLASGWTSTFESQEIAQAILHRGASRRCEDWEIEPRDPDHPGQRTGDPVLDGSLSFRGFDESDLQQLVGLENATPILMAALVAHGARLEKGYLKLQRPGFVADPQALFEDITALEDLLLIAAG